MAKRALTEKELAYRAYLKQDSINSQRLRQKARKEFNENEYVASNAQLEYRTRAGRVGQVYIGVKGEDR